jgi:hypothetical protein
MPGPSQAYLDDEDAQLALYCLYELDYRGFDDVPAAMARDPRVVRLRADLGDALWRAVGDQGVLPDPAELLDALCPGDTAESTYEATPSSVDRWLAHRACYHLKESHAHAVLLLHVTDETVRHTLAEVVAGEFGVGFPSTHADLFAQAMASRGLDTRAHAYLDATPAGDLAMSNLLSLGCFRRELAPWAVGQLVYLECDSVGPAKQRLADAERLDLPAPVGHFHRVHVHADAEHEAWMRQVVEHPCWSAADRQLLASGIATMHHAMKRTTAWAPRAVALAAK